MSKTRLGILLWSQAANWPQFEQAARHVDRLGYDHLWTWDHLYAIFGDPYQPIFEGWTAIAGCAQVTSRVRLGLMVGANTFRNPSIVTKSVVTLDHISGGRAILGLGGAWHQLEHEAHGIEFGRSAGERLDWLDEAVGVARRLLDGETVDHSGPHYEFKQLRQEPRPIQRHLPIAIGGAGEKKTLRTVALHADIWNAFGDVETLKHKASVLRGHCDDVGRDPADIEFTVGCKPLIRDTEAEAKALWQSQMEANRTPISDVSGDASFWVGTPTQLAEKIAWFKEVGFDTVVSEMAAPYDSETLERLIGEVRPMIDG
ncbi:MAG TPA: LLM class flavin-dependent oxidoreductase [Acidimicrobiia bacterium]|nr:LLM class flavin-dependent oxidoreductase [Acidimicrobiia bacterium]